MASLGCCDISIQESLLFYKLRLVKKINFLKQKMSIIKFSNLLFRNNYFCI